MQQPNLNQLAADIDQAFALADPTSFKDAVKTTIELLNRGVIRAAVKTDKGWVAQAWVKKAILLHFKLQNSYLIENGPFHYYDKIGLKYSDYTAQNFIADRVRVVPQATVREGVYVGPNCVLMPSYLNIGVYVDSGSMIDIWATIGSCAQIGKNCHISSNTCIGGVLEPLQETPVIIEDNCFIGTNVAIVEGVVIEEHSVIAMGVRIGQSTKIYDRVNDRVLAGRIPAGSVVVPGSFPSSNRKYNLECAVIVKNVDAVTRSKVSVNQLLREAEKEN